MVQVRGANPLVDYTQYNLPNPERVRPDLWSRGETSVFGLPGSAKPWVSTSIPASASAAPGLAFLPQQRIVYSPSSPPWAWYWDFP